MADAIAFHVLSRTDLQTGRCDPAWTDPDSVAVMSQPRRRAILANPMADNPADPAQILATRGNELVGRIDFIPGILHSPLGDQRIFWCSNLFVPERCRSTLAGVSLILRSQQVPGVVGAFGPSQLALPVYQKLKWLDRPIPRYILMRRSRSIVERYLRRGPHSTAVSLLTDAALGLHRLLQAPLHAIRTRGFQVEHVSAMPADLDPLLAAPRGVVAVGRSSAMLNWWLAHRFKDDPRDRNDLYLVRNRQGAPVGYFLNKIRFYESATHRQFKNLLLGSIQDWMVFDPAALDFKSIILLATRELCRRRADAVELCTDDPSVRGMLRRMGFLRAGDLHLLVRLPPGSPLAAPPYSDFSNWWIRPADGDNFLS